MLNWNFVFYLVMKDILHFLLHISLACNVCTFIKKGKTHK